MWQGGFSQVPQAVKINQYENNRFSFRHLNIRIARHPASLRHLVEQAAVQTLERKDQASQPYPQGYQEEF